MIRTSTKPARRRSAVPNQRRSKRARAAGSPVPDDASHETNAGDARTHRRPQPPLVLFRSFKAALRAIKDQGEDGSAIDLRAPNYKMHSINRLEMLKAFRFLGLTDEAYLPTPKLGALVRALGTRAWPRELRLVVTKAYSDLFGVSAVTFAAGALLPSIRTVYSITSDEARRAAEFFIHAAREAALETGHVQPRSRKATAGRSPDAPRSEAISALVSRFPAYDPEWPDDAKSLWLKAYLELVRQVTGESLLVE